MHCLSYRCDYQQEDANSRGYCTGSIYKLGSWRVDIQHRIEQLNPLSSFHPFPAGYCYGRSRLLYIVTGGDIPQRGWLQSASMQDVLLCLFLKASENRTIPYSYVYFTVSWRLRGHALKANVRNPLRLHFTCVCWEVPRCRLECLCKILQVELRAFVCAGVYHGWAWACWQSVTKSTKQWYAMHAWIWDIWVKLGPSRVLKDLCTRSLSPASSLGNSQSPGLAGLGWGIGHALLMFSQLGISFCARMCVTTLCRFWMILDALY